ncbi:FixH family protein [Altererythrobacter sp. GH1-8]|uniref:FixH family protein n=1 Tax=Altererythrobacter sp. GH1-8 TaxID=3349333 RepID=UPI00374CD648
MTREFTGRDMTKVLVIGFGIVVAVNFFMASQATSGFGGVVVENSYVASQKFNGWLEEAERSRALGWQAAVTRDEAGYLLVTTQGVPAQASITAELRRPIGERETANVGLAAHDTGQYRSVEPISAGRWTARIVIEAGQDRWAEETPVP